MGALSDLADVDLVPDAVPAAEVLDNPLVKAKASLSAVFAACHCISLGLGCPVELLRCPGVRPRRTKAERRVTESDSGIETKRKGSLRPLLVLKVRTN